MVTSVHTAESRKNSDCVAANPKVLAAEQPRLESIYKATERASANGPIGGFTLSICVDADRQAPSL